MIQNSLASVAGGPLLSGILTDTSFQLVAQLLSFPLGKAWARLFPTVKIFGVSLNPGPFTLKEHVVITIMATVGSTSAYAVRVESNPLSLGFLLMTALIQTDVLAVQRVYYGQNWSFLYQWMLVISTQLIGFSLGGIVKRFLVSPPSMSKLLSLSCKLAPDNDAVHDPVAQISMAIESGLVCPFQHPPFAAIRCIWQALRHEPRALFPLRFLCGYGLV